MQHFPRQTSGTSSSPPTTPTDAGPSSNSTSVNVAQNSTSISIPSTSRTLPSSTLTSLPPSVTSSPPPTSAPASSTTSDSSTSLPISNSTSLDASPSDTPSLLAESTSQPASVSSTQPLENITTIVTSINGQITTFTSLLPTSLVNATPNNDSGSSSRTAVIAGATAGVIVLLCLALSSVFAYRRHRLRQILALTNQKKEGKGLLDGEEFDEDDASIPIRWQGRNGSPAPSLIRSRVSDTGSIFREEVWPPPGFVDPIKQGSSQVTLSHIVDDVMGPTQSRSTSRLEQQDPASSTSDLSHGHQRDTSTTGLLPRSSSPLDDPFNPNHNVQSVYYSPVLPPGALPPSMPGQISYPPSPPRSGGNDTIPRIMETPPTPGPGPGSFEQHQRNNSNGSQPRKSSPLTRPLSGDLWLNRSPYPP
ncbi:hypothetical protein JR316_0010418 [Psilocybe cubensis]|uniref:Uncharacterized protein n=2 Tax=Psilocybe cubensis TaxID=181762 RepID=A0A8H7XLK9_PSICU|nr:hypothetical protein JR316_0010418 [Psilocybe cubensis]KAH9476506.1 hypothetical protein JR316_0010418 [Psilocybe cubensis]